MAWPGTRRGLDWFSGARLAPAIEEGRVPVFVGCVKRTNPLALAALGAFHAPYEEREVRQSLRSIRWGSGNGMEILGIGTDIIECPRIGKMIEQHGELFLRRVYTEREIRYCQSRKH